MIVILFQGYNSLIWGNLIKSVTDPGIISRQAEDNKVTKHRSLLVRFLFALNAVKKFDVQGSQTDSLLGQIILKDHKNKPW